MRTVIDLLSEAATSERPVWYLIMPGNAGDTLISVGFFDAAERAGLSYSTTTDVEDIPSGAFVFVNGGGYLVPEWGGEAARSRIEEVSRKSGRLVLLPMSTRGFDNFLCSLPAGTDVFLRENFSYDRLTEVALDLSSSITLHRDHDTAFHVDPQPLLSKVTPRGFFRLLKPKDKIRYGMYLQSRGRSRFTSTIRALRADPESARNPGRLSVLSDLSLLAFFGGSDETQCRLSAALFLQAIQPYDHVITDRLHTAVAAALLEKRVTMIEGSYYKLGGVYEQSLSDNLNVTFALP